MGVLALTTSAACGGRTTSSQSHGNEAESADAGALRPDDAGSVDESSPAADLVLDAAAVGRCCLAGGSAYCAPQFPLSSAFAR